MYANSLESGVVTTLLCTCLKGQVVSRDNREDDEGQGENSLVTWLKKDMKGEFEMKKKKISRSI